MFEKEELKEAIKKVRESSKKRNFVQSVELIVNLKDLDLKKPENRMNEVVFLPKGRGKEAKVVLFSDSIKEAECEILSSKEIELLAKNKREAKKLANKTDFFLAEPVLMPVVGRYLGIVLGPRGKMPKVVSGDVNAMVRSLKNSVRIKVKDNPTVQCMIGTEGMGDEELAENALAVLKFLEEKLPKGRKNVRNVLVKFTMSKPVKVGKG